MKSFLSDIEQQELKSLHKKCKERRFADRIKTILLLNKGFSVADVAELLLLDDDTIRSYKNNYLEKGVNTLLSDGNKGGLSKMTSEQEQELDLYLTQNTHRASKGIAAWIVEKFNITYTNSGINALLKRLGFVYKKPVLTPCKADVSKQEEFQKKHQELKSNLGINDHIYFMDGVHPQHNSVASCGWIKKGVKKELKTNNGRQRINLNGVLNLATKDVLLVENDRINSQTVVETLEKIQVHQEQGKINIVLDNARYYHSHIVKEYLKDNQRIELQFLPPYYPNLNVIERLWLILKQNVVYNKFYEKFADFKEKVHDFFKNQTWKNQKYNSRLTDNLQIIKPNFTNSCFV